MKPMLKYYDDIKEMRDVGPRRRDEFNYCQRLLQQSNPGAEQHIREAINTFVHMKLNEKGWTNELLVCSSFIPGADWTCTPYQPIFDAMCERYGQDPLTD